MTNIEELKEWASNNAVLIGSAALGVETEDSDLDYAVSEEDFELLNINLETTILNAKDYVNVTPPLGNTKLLRLKGIDLLIYPTQGYVDDIENCIEILKNVPKVFLKDKGTRCTLFEFLLRKCWCQDK